MNHFLQGTINKYLPCKKVFRNLFGFLFVFGLLTSLLNLNQEAAAAAPGTMTVAGQNGVVYSTTDGGKTWKSISPSYSYNYSQLVKTEDGIALVGTKPETYFASSALYFSNGDSTWKNVYSNVGLQTYVTGNGTHVVAGGHLGYIGVSSVAYTSQNTTNWAKTMYGMKNSWDARESDYYMGWIQSSIYTNGKFYLVGDNGYYTSKVSESTDGKTWSPTKVPYTIYGNLRNIAYVNGKFIGVGKYHHSSSYHYPMLVVADDPMKWTGNKLTGAHGYNAILHGVAYGNGTYVAVGASGFGSSLVLTSTDAQTWTAVTVNSRPLYAISFDEKSGQFVAVGDNTIITSANGTAWTATPTVPNGFFRTVIPAVAGKGMLEQVKDAIDKLEEQVKDGLPTQDQIDQARKEADRIQDQLNQLPPGADRDALQQRLDQIKKQIEAAQNVLDAIRAVERLEQAVLDLSNPDLISRAEQLYREAQTAVDKLPAGELKDSLQARIDAAKLKIDIAKAIAAVEKAEQSLSQADVDAAYPLVNALPDGELKTSLLERLALIQKIIDITKLLNNLPPISIGSCDYAEQLRVIETMINSLPDSSTYKADLLAKLNAAENNLITTLLTLLQEKTGGKAEAVCHENLNYLVEHAIEQTGATSQKDRGQVHGYLQPILQGHATGADLNKLINKLLP